MKKMMIAAAAAAISLSSFGSLCDDDPIEAVGCAVWNVKFTAKTLAPKAITVKFDCDDDVNACYLESGSRTIDGIIWMCEAVCDLNAGNVVMWEAKQKAAVSAPLSWNDADKVWVADLMDGIELNRFSKKANKVAAYWGFAFDTFNGVAAGQGAFDAKLGLLKNVSGYFAGKIVPAPLNLKCDECNGAWMDMCEDFEDWTVSGYEADEVPAYGAWSIKYNAGLSKGTKRLSQIVPVYAQNR